MDSERPTQKDAMLKEATGVLRTILQRYKDLSHMQTPEWELEREEPVQQAEEVLDGEYSEAVHEEFSLLRDLSRRVEVLVSKIENLEDGEMNAEEMFNHLDEIKVLKDEISEMVNRHINLKEQQDIVRLDPETFTPIDSDTNE